MCTILLDNDFKYVAIIVMLNVNTIFFAKWSAIFVKIGLYTFNHTDSLLSIYRTVIYILTYTREYSKASVCAMLSFSRDTDIHR